MASLFAKAVTLIFFAQAFFSKESLTAYFQAAHSESHLPHPASLFPIMSNQHL